VFLYPDNCTLHPSIPMSNTQRPYAVITGASAGLGKTYSWQLAGQGNDLMIVARRAEQLERLKKEIENRFPVTVDVYVADLADEKQVAQLAEKIVSLPRLDTMINNAGFGLQKRFPNVDVEAEARMIRLHCEASMRLCQAASDLMCRQKYGHIINVCSFAAYLTGPGAADYCATKAFLKSFSECLQDDIGEFGVKVQALCPGFVHTEFHDTAMMKGFDKNSLPGFTWMDADYVVRTSLRAIQKKRHRVVVIPSLAYKLIYVITHIPVISPILAGIVKKRLKRK